MIAGGSEAGATVYALVVNDLCIFGCLFVMSPNTVSVMNVDSNVK